MTRSAWIRRGKSSIQKRQIFPDTVIVIFAVKFTFSPMPERLFMARMFFLGGAVLAVIGFILWFVLPIRLSFPPFLLTALLAVVYGVVCLERGRPKEIKKRPVAAKGKT